MAKSRRKDKAKKKSQKHHTSKPPVKLRNDKDLSKESDRSIQSEESMSDCKSSKGSLKKRPVVELVALSPLLKRAIPEEE